MGETGRRVETGLADHFVATYGERALLAALSHLEDTVADALRLGLTDHPSGPVKIADALAVVQHVRMALSSPTTEH